MPLKPEPTLRAKTTINSRTILRTRRYSEGARPLSAIPLSESLQELARNLWFSVEPITEIYDVYSLYAGMMEHHSQTLANSCACSQPLHELWKLGIKRGSPPTFVKLKEILLHELINARSNYLNARQRITNPYLKRALQHRAQRINLTIEDYLTLIMENEFYHYFAKNLRYAHSRHRIYLNVKNQIITPIMSYIINECLDKIPDVEEVKVTLGNYPDKIIIYTRNRPAMNKVLAALKHYQHNNGIDGFKHSLPAMTSQQLTGVSTADSPPNVCFINGEVMPSVLGSFGLFLCNLIYQAFKDSNGSTEFFELIVKYFKAAGLDPKDPSIQTRFKHLTWEAQSNFVRSITLRQYHHCP